MISWYCQWMTSGYSNREICFSSTAKPFQLTLDSTFPQPEDKKPSTNHFTLESMPVPTPEQDYNFKSNLYKLYYSGIFWGGAFSFSSSSSSFFLIFIFHCYFKAMGSMKVRAVSTPISISSWVRRWLEVVTKQKELPFYKGFSLSKLFMSVEKRCLCL